MSQKMDLVLGKYYQRQAFQTDWPKEIETFLILIRLLPFKPGARSLANVETFQNSVKRLLIFSNVHFDIGFISFSFHRTFFSLMVVVVVI